MTDADATVVPNLSDVAEKIAEARTDALTEDITRWATELELLSEQMRTAAADMGTSE